MLAQGRVRRERLAWSLGVWCEDSLNGLAPSRVSIGSRGLRVLVRGLGLSSCRG